jgi:hypothetical protein
MSRRHLDARSQESSRYIAGPAVSPGASKVTARPPISQAADVIDRILDAIGVGQIVSDREGFRSSGIVN